MLSEEQIKKVLHADRVVPLGVSNPHGPLGLEQLAEAVSRLAALEGDRSCVERPIALPVETWRKLDELARHVRQEHSNTITASGVAAAILEQAVKAQ